MVRDLLDPGFLRTQLERIQAEVGLHLPQEEYERALAELRGAEGRAAASFMPRHPANAMLQSTLEVCITSRGDQLLRELDPDSPVGTHELVDQELYRQFGRCDIRWIESKIAEGWQLFAGRAAFVDKPAPPLRIANDARLVLVGDWATGLPAAANVGRQMRRVVESGRGEKREQHVIHLGDVYYSGWAEEYRDRFLPFWPVHPKEQDVTSWAVNGNHDMYSGGHGYYGFLLRDERFKHQGESSWFSLESDHWQVLGLDTAYKNHDLDGSQPNWIKEKLQGAKGRRTMLLSHHQLFSAHDPPATGKDMQASVAGALAVGKVDAWFWGHEHRCVVYKEGWHTPQVARARCVGHGGVPQMVDAPTAPLPDGVEYELRDARVDGPDRWALFGFAVLDFDGPSVRVRYIDERGNENHSEVIG